MEMDFKRLGDINAELTLLKQRVEELEAEKANIIDPPLTEIQEFTTRHQNAFRRAGLKTVSDLSRFLEGDRGLSRANYGFRGSYYEKAKTPRQRLMAMSCIGEKSADEMMQIIKSLGLVQ